MSPTRSVTRRVRLPMSWSSSQNAGTASSAATDETRMPKASEIAIGTSICAAGLSLSMSGVRPANVVTVVIRMGRKRETAALTSASSNVSPPARKRFTP